MRTFDMSPLYRSTVGFDRLFSLLDAVDADAAPAYPPYNIEKTGDDTYRITLAVAGFTEDELSIELKDTALTIAGGKPDDTVEARTFLHRGIAARGFKRRFQLADHIKVTGAALEHGLLHVDLVHEVPEAKKPRQIAIGRATAASGTKVLEGKDVN